MAATTSSRSRFDKVAAIRVEKIIAAADLKRALWVLGNHLPRSTRDRVEHERLLARVLSLSGQYLEAKAHAVRALRLTSRFPQRRPAVRWQLAVVMLRTGDISMAIHQLEHGLTEVRAGHGEATSGPQLMATMAMIHRRDGALSTASVLYTQAATEAESLKERFFFGARRNMVLIQTHMGNFSEARTLLESLLRDAGGEDDADQRALLQLTRALLALHTGDLDDCAAALASAGELSNGSALRTRIILREYTADMKVARGQAAEAVAELEELLAEVQELVPLGDLVPEVARRLATALLMSGRPEAGIAPAELAILTGRTADRLECAAGLRVAAMCHAVLGQDEHARARFAEAAEYVQATEFFAEYGRLVLAMREAGVTPPAPLLARAASVPAFRSTPRHREPTILTLMDGRRFVTGDRGLVESIRRAAAGDLPVLIEGETGTGKELVARLVHELGPRSKSLLVVLDCTSLPESLAESELFGVARGAFTGASESRIGLVAAASGGTLFLDELADLPLPLQSKLLRLLQEGTYRKLGETSERRASIRVIAASNRGTDQLVRDGRLRQDLYFRLSGHRLMLTPLRSRPEDIGLLAREVARSAGFSGVDETALKRLKAHSWPGNVRELQMLVRVASVHAGRGGLLTAEVIERSGGFSMGRSVAAATARVPRRKPIGLDDLTRILQACDGNRSAAARLLGVSREGLRLAMKRHGVT